MKKNIQKIIFLTIVLLYSCSISKADTIKYEDWRTREMLQYDASNYQELYSVFEDLNNDYSRLIEEYYSLQRTVEEKNYEIDKLNEKLDEIEQDDINIRTENDESITQLLGLCVVIIAIYLVYYITKNKNTNDKM